VQGELLEHVLDLLGSGFSHGSKEWERGERWERQREVRVKGGVERERKKGKKCSLPGVYPPFVHNPSSGTTSCRFVQQDL